MKKRCLWKAKLEETFLYTLLHCDTRKEDFWSRETRNNNRILILRQNPIYSISPSALNWSKCANKSTISIENIIRTLTGTEPAPKPFTRRVWSLKSPGWWKLRRTPRSDSQSFGASVNWARRMRRGPRRFSSSVGSLSSWTSLAHTTWRRSMRQATSYR